jgi:PIN domain nuclease of toxin-antitoxin system
MDRGGKKAWAARQGNLPIANHWRCRSRDPRDPCDRLLVAKAAREGLQLLTTDRTLAGYGEHVRWVAG